MLKVGLLILAISALVLAGAGLGKPGLTVRLSPAETLAVVAPAVAIGLLLVVWGIRDEEKAERERHGCIPGALHAPYPDLADNIRPGGVLHGLATATGRRLVFFCAFGERSAMAVQAAQDAGLTNSAHIAGGMGAWKKAGGPLA